MKTTSSKIKAIAFIIVLIMVVFSNQTAIADVTPKVKTDKGIYSVGETIRVSFFNAPGNNRDWACIVAAGSPDDNAGDYKLMSTRESEGVLTFDAPPPGKYEVRAFYNYSSNGYVVSARYSFTVVDMVSPAKPVTGTEEIKSEAVVVPDRSTVDSDTAIRDSKPPNIIITSPSVKRGLKLLVKQESVMVTGQVTDDSGVTFVAVNGVKVDLDESGSFTYDALLKVGENTIIVTAMDVHGNARTERFPIVRAAQKSAKTEENTTIPVSVDGRNYALIIGINHYNDDIGGLKTAVNDANKVSKVLSDHYEFDCTLLIDRKATRSGILNALSSIKKRLNPNDRFLLYYAGHGYFDKDTGTSYWLPSDAEKDNMVQWIDAKSVTSELRRSQSRQILVVADSCYSGAMVRAFTPSLEGRGTRDVYLKKLMDKPSRVLIASGGNEPVADAGGNGHSIFADAFINALMNPFESSFTAEELMVMQIKETVGGKSEQTPEYKIITNSGHEGGDFIFVKVR